MNKRKNLFCVLVSMSLMGCGGGGNAGNSDNSRVIDFSKASELALISGTWRLSALKMGSVSCSESTTPCYWSEMNIKNDGKFGYFILSDSDNIAIKIGVDDFGKSYRAEDKNKNKIFESDEYEYDEKLIDELDSEQIEKIDDEYSTNEEDYESQAIYTVTKNKLKATFKDSKEDYLEWVKL